jgi:antitoxin HicB
MMITQTKTSPAPKASQSQDEHNCLMLQGYPLQVTPLSEEDGGGFQALYPPLARSIVGYGETPQEAIAELQTLVPSFLDMIARSGQTLPEVAAEKDWDEYSGKFNVRVLKALHAQLVELAEEQGVSLNSLVQSLLTSGATALAAGKMFGMQQPEVRLKFLYQWSETNKGQKTFHTSGSPYAKERSRDRWLPTQEG